MVTRGKKMPVLSVKGKTGFRNISGNPILILDERGERFYDTRQLLKRVQMFNLPEGTYKIAQGDIARMAKPVNYELAPLPAKERTLNGDFSNFEMHFVNNPATGTVVPTAREKFYDHDLKNLPLPYAIFIDEHENGHKYYITESYCDLYAANKMLERGYNPSQIAEAIIFTLSPDKVARKELIVESLLPSMNSYNANADPAAGLFVYSDKKVSIYANPGEKVMSVAPPGEYIGRIAKLNTARTWIQLTEGGRVTNGWIFITPDLKFRKGKDLPPLTSAQKADILKGTIMAAAGVGAVPNAEIVYTAADVAQSAGKTAKTLVNTGANIADFLSNHLIIILIVASLLMLALTYNHAKS